MVDLSQRERSGKLNRRGNEINISLSRVLGFITFRPGEFSQFPPPRTFQSLLYHQFIDRRAWFALLPSSTQLDSGKYSNYRSSSSIIRKQSSRDFLFILYITPTLGFIESIID